MPEITKEELNGYLLSGTATPYELGRLVGEIIRHRKKIGDMVEIFELINNESMSEQSALDSLVTCVNLAAKALGMDYDKSGSVGEAMAMAHYKKETP